MTTSLGYFREIYSYRHLLYEWVVERFSARFYRTLLGMFWLVIQPAATALVFTIVFSVITRIAPDDLPYPVFFLVGYVPWTYFSTVIINNSRSITSNLHLIQNYRFPRELLVYVPLLTELFEALVGTVILLLLILVFRVPTTGLGILLVLPLFGLQMLLVLGLSLWMAALNARYRDIGLVLQPVMRLAFYLTPVIYDISAVPEGFRGLYLLNPLAGLVSAYRDIVFVGAITYPMSLLWVCVVTGVVLASGFYFFKRSARHFADIV